VLSFLSDNKLAVAAATVAVTVGLLAWRKRASAAAGEFHSRLASDQPFTFLSAFCFGLFCNPTLTSSSFFSHLITPSRERLRQRAHSLPGRASQRPHG
jgi:hypothetical protein